MTSSTEKSANIPQSFLYVSGSLLVLSGLIHVVVWVLLGGDWEGSVSWRKPILFGFSTGLTVLSIAWLYPKLLPLWALTRIFLHLITEELRIT